MLKLFDYQLEAIYKLKTGSILCGGVGSGKSLTSLGYYYLQQGGSRSFLMGDEYVKMENPKDLYIITTARKRDTLEWEGEMRYYLLSTNSKINLYKNQTVIVDSWNNIKKYSNIKNAFFIFDEQRVVGYGEWSKTFIKIAKVNDWILLSATPGQKWEDYIPVFIANGFYKNKTEFVYEHIVYSRYIKYKIDRYLNVRRLIRLREKILVDMDFARNTTAHHKDVYCSYDVATYKDLFKYRWDIYKDEPMQNAASLCYVARRLVNSDKSRQEALLKILKNCPRAIIFYNFDYELDILKSIDYDNDVEIGEWNGHKHQPIPDSNKWIYLVQYTAGAEGWNCIKTDTIIFYSQNYSYRIMEQSAGRIDRLNTPYKDLYYYHLKSRSGIDLAISKALRQKEKFSERKFIKWD